LARLGEVGQVLVAEISAVLTELLQQPAAILIRQAPDHLQEVLGELGIGHELRLALIQIFIVRRILIAPLAPFFSPGPPPGHRIGGVSYLQAGCGLALGQLSPLPLQRLDLRNFYRDMREALITANRRAGAQQGLVTKARKKIAKLEVELSRLERERDDLISYRQRVEREANEISAMLPRLKARLLQVRQIEQALENLADIKEAVDQQERADAVEFFEETVEDIESKPESESDRDSSSDNSPESGEASDER
jgi:hypothetical protein